MSRVSTAWKLIFWSCKVQLHALLCSFCSRWRMLSPLKCRVERQKIPDEAWNGTTLSVRKQSPFTSVRRYPGCHIIYQVIGGIGGMCMSSVMHSSLNIHDMFGTRSLARFRVLNCRSIRPPWDPLSVTLPLCDSEVNLWRIILLSSRKRCVDNSKVREMNVRWVSLLIFQLTRVPILVLLFWDLF